eukprot:107025-Hanusia_phi.AAC.2
MQENMLAAVVGVGGFMALAMAHRREAAANAVGNELSSASYEDIGHFVQNERVSLSQRDAPLCPISPNVEAKHVEFLNAMIKKFGIKDFDKAIRIAVQFAISDGDADALFVKKRCNTCGGKKNKSKVSVKLYKHQVEFLEQTQRKFKIKSVDVRVKLF